MDGYTVMMIFFQPAQFQTQGEAQVDDVPDRGHPGDPHPDRHCHRFHHQVLVRGKGASVTQGRRLRKETMND